MKTVGKISKRIILGLILIGSFLLSWWYLKDLNIAVLEPAGGIAARQHELILFTILLSLIIVIPVFALTIFIVLRYRESNKKATYKPNWDHHRGLETLWWGVPLILISVLAVVTWQTSYELDPYKKIASNQKPVTVQVIALQWKWLFLYTESGVASVNELYIPEDRPINFQITADAPMNSFWIPKLGGQIYAMTGMSTQLNLIAADPGVYRGVSANLSGEGFADMHFNAVALNDADYKEWETKAKQSTTALTISSYTELAKPGVSKPVLYGRSQNGIYDTVISKYMDGHQHGSHVSEGHN